jgi:PhnB protein
MANVKRIPEGYHTITPYLIVRGASRAIEFYKQAFGAREIYRMEGPNGTVMHAEMQIGDSRFMLGDEQPSMGYSAPQPGTKVPVGLYIYVEDVDALAARAISAGITVDRPVADQFYGDRTGAFTDPFGHSWSLATHVEDVSADEIRRRMEQAMKKSA